MPTKKPRTLRFRVDKPLNGTEGLDLQLFWDGRWRTVMADGYIDEPHITDGCKVEEAIRWALFGHLRAVKRKMEFTVEIRNEA